MDGLRYRCFNFFDDKIAAAFADKREAEQFARLKNCRLEDSHTQVIRGEIRISGSNAYVWVTEPGKDSISLGTILLDRFGLLLGFDANDGEILQNFRIVVEPDPYYLKKEDLTIVLDAQEMEHAKADKKR